MDLEAIEARVNAVKGGPCLVGVRELLSAEVGVGDHDFPDDGLLVGGELQPAFGHLSGLAPQDAACFHGVALALDGLGVDLGDAGKRGVAPVGVAAVEVALVGECHEDGALSGVDDGGVLQGPDDGVEAHRVPPWGRYTGVSRRVATRFRVRATM